MTKRDDGGPAFPRAAVETAYYLAQDGMTLRDYFAGQALAGLAYRQFIGDPRAAPAIESYEMADAMLRARAEVEA